MKRGIAVRWIVFTLSGCMTAQERQAQAIQNMDASDDAYCRRQADSTVTYAAGRCGDPIKLTATNRTNGLSKHTLGRRRQNYLPMKS
ncbi:MAG: hypothetical protein ACLP19_27660 [Xanthobacteraceae bacterium]